MKYYIYEETTYETEADSPREAMLKFQRDLKYPGGFSVEVHERNVTDAQDNDVTEEAEAEEGDLAARRDWRRAYASEKLTERELRERVELQVLRKTNPKAFRLTPPKGFHYSGKVDCWGIPEMIHTATGKTSQEYDQGR
jgi:hypothetical protein